MMSAMIYHSAFLSHSAISESTVVQILDWWYWAAWVGDMWCTWCFVVHVDINKDAWTKWPWWHSALCMLRWVRPEVVAIVTVETRKPGDRAPSVIFTSVDCDNSRMKHRLVPIIHIGLF